MAINTATLTMNWNRTPAHRAPTNRPRWVITAAMMIIAAGVAFTFASHLFIGAHSTPSARTPQVSSSAKAATENTLFTRAANDTAAGNLAGARTQYLAILAADSSNKFAYYDLGVLYQKNGQAGAAAQAYQLALGVDSQYVPALFNLAIVDSISRPADAAQLYQRIEEISPNAAAAYLNLGLLDHQLGDSAAATAQLQTALHLEPSWTSRIPTSLAAELH